MQRIIVASFIGHVGGEKMSCLLPCGLGMRLRVVVERTILGSGADTLRIL